MLRNRLNVLLAEHELTIKDVHEDTGLSRTTISNMINKPGGTVNMDTLDVLCRYLGISPGDFFLYSPYNVTVFPDEGLPSALHVGVQRDRKEYAYEYGIELSMNPWDLMSPGADSRISDTYDVYMRLHIGVGGDGLSDLLPKLPVAFQNQITAEIIRALERFLSATDPASLTGDSDFDNGRTAAALETIRRLKMPDISISLPWVDTARRFDVQQGIFVSTD